MLQYSICFMDLWVLLDTGRLTLNARCIKRGMSMTSCCCLLLTTAEPGHLHQNTDYFHFSSIFDSNEDKNLYRENTLSNEYACCRSTIIHIVDSQPCDRWQLYHIEPSCCWVNYGEAHEIVLSLPLRLYCLMSLTPNILQGVFMTSLVSV